MKARPGWYTDEKVSSCAAPFLLSDELVIFYENSSLKNEIDQ
jgi:hypothetical protein